MQAMHLEKGDSAIFERLVELLKTAPECNRLLLSAYVNMLSCVARNGRVNKMVSANCAIVLGPNILRRQNELQDARASAMMAMDSSDVNRVAEFLITHPQIVSHFVSRPPNTPFFETKLVGHSKSVLSLFRLGASVGSLDSAGAVCLWNATTLAFESTFDIGWRPLGAVSSGKAVWIYGQKGVEVRDAQGTKLFSHGSPYFCGAFVSDDRVWLGTDKALVVFDSVSYEESGRVPVECELLFNLCYIPSQDELWGGGLDNSVYVYDVKSCSVKHVIKAASRKRVNQINMQTPTQAVIVSEDGTLSSWSVASRTQIRLVQAHESRCNCVSVAADGRIWTCGWDTSIRVFSPDLELLTTFTGYHDDAVFTLMSVGEKQVWGGSGDKGLSIWSW